MYTYTYTCIFFWQSLFITQDVHHMKVACNYGGFTTMYDYKIKTSQSKSIWSTVHLWYCPNGCGILCFCVFQLWSPLWHGGSGIRPVGRPATSEGRPSAFCKISGPRPSTLKGQVIFWSASIVEGWIWQYNPHENQSIYSIKTVAGYFDSTARVRKSSQGVPLPIFRWLNPVSDCGKVIIFRMHENLLRYLLKNCSADLPQFCEHGVEFQ